LLYHFRGQLEREAAMARARFLVDLGDVKLSGKQQKEIAQAIQGAVLHKLAHHLAGRPHIDLAKAPGSGGWAGMMLHTKPEGLEKLKKENSWGRPRRGKR
jgi:hypothetical protein